MRKTRQKPLSGVALREAGWNVLVEHMGLVNATRFVLLYETGRGDYSRLRAKLFQGKKVADICKEISNKQR